MIKVKRYVVTQVLVEEKDGKLEFWENFWPQFHNTFTEAKNSLSDEIESINEFDEETAKFNYDKEKGTMVYLEICSANFYKEHRSDELAEDGTDEYDADTLKAHYCLIPKNCPKYIMEAIKTQLVNKCPVVKYNG